MHIIMEFKVMSTKKAQEESLLRRNPVAIIATIIAIVSLIFSGINLYLYYTELNPPPPRAKLTIFVEHHVINYGTSNELNFEVFGEIVNDSPLTAFIRKWELFLLVNMSYQIVGYKLSLPELSLSTSEETTFRMGRSLMGSNDTKLPETAIKNCVVTIWYEDDIGMQQTEKEYSFIS